MDLLLQQKYENILDLSDEIQDKVEELKTAVMDFAEAYAEVVDSVDINNKDLE
jgi:hypothetical protein